MAGRASWLVNARQVSLRALAGTSLIGRLLDNETDLVLNNSVETNNRIIE